MGASKWLPVPTVVVLVLTCSCSSVFVGEQKRPVIFGISALEAFKNAHFEQIAAYPEIRRLASPRTVVVVWRERISGWDRVKAIGVPAGRTVSEILGVPVGETLSSAHGILVQEFVIAFAGISRVVIIHGDQQLILDGNAVVSSNAETKDNPIPQPGAIVFVEEAPPSPAWWEKEWERKHGTPPPWRRLSP